jgi:squalene synthase HpnC
MVTGLDEAYDTCARTARDHYENFPVASWLLPRRMRPHVAAVYAFARAADDFSDEGDRSPEVRLALLADWRERLLACTAADTDSVSAGLKPRAICSPSPDSPPPGSHSPDTAGLQACALCRPSPESHSPDTAGLHPSTLLGVTLSEPLDASRSESKGQACATAAADNIFLALSSTIRACRLPVSLFDDLLSAFRQDVTTTRYETWDDVLDYCRRSANPVGRLVLGIAAVEDEALATSSDAVCMALQLTNFWQDLARDWRRGRLYLPLEDCRREGADPADLDAGRLTPAWKNVLRGAGARTAGLFEQGRAVCDGVGGRLGIELRLTWLGGRRILSRLESADYDVFHRRPALGAPDVPALLWQAIRWRAR